MSITARTYVTISKIFVIKKTLAGGFCRLNAAGHV